MCVCGRITDYFVWSCFVFLLVYLKNHNERRACWSLTRADKTLSSCLRISVSDITRPWDTTPTKNKQKTNISLDVCATIEANTPQTEIGYTWTRGWSGLRNTPAFFSKADLDPVWPVIDTPWITVCREETNDCTIRQGENQSCGFRLDSIMQHIHLLAGLCHSWHSVQLVWLSKAAGSLLLNQPQIWDSLISFPRRAENNGNYVVTNWGMNLKWLIGTYTCLGFSWRPCFNSCRTLHSCDLMMLTGCLKIEAVCRMGGMMERSFLNPLAKSGWAFLRFFLKRMALILPVLKSNVVRSTVSPKYRTNCGLLRNFLPFGL